MAKRNDMSKPRPIRNRTPKARSTSRAAKAAAKSASVPNLDALENAIEDERHCLMIAHSQLSCAILAMESEEISNVGGPHYPSIVRTACEMIDRSIKRLDWLELNRVMQEATLDEEDEDSEDELNSGLHGDYKVEEPRPVYLC